VEKVKRKSKLFENLGSANTESKFAELKNKFSKYDEEYLSIATDSSRSEEKKWMEELWQKCESYLDTNFLDEFKLKTGYLNRSWELYLGATLLNRGFKLGKHSDADPDFDLLNKEGKRIAWIEAVAPEKGNGKDRVSNNLKSGTSGILPEEKMLLHITGVFNDKFEEYKKYLKNNKVNDQEPYVIAINCSNFSRPDPGIPLILMALFGIGDLGVRIPIRHSDARHESSEWFWSHRPEIRKNNNTDIPMLIFRDRTYAGISAVIYCKSYILNCRKSQEKMGENFIVAHNHLANNHLPDGFFPFGDEYKDKEIGDSVVRIHERKKRNKSDLF